MDDKNTPLKFEPDAPGEVLAVQIPGAVIRIQANVTDERGRITTTVDVLVANDERGGDPHGNVWDLDHVQNLDQGGSRVTLACRGPIMTNPQDYGQLVRERLADLGLSGIVALGNGGQVRLGQVVVKQTSPPGGAGKVAFLGGDRVLVGRPKYTTDQSYYYVYSPRTGQEHLVPRGDVHIDARAPRWAYWINPVQDDRATGGYVPSVVIEEVSGHWPLDGAGVSRPWVWGATLQDARDRCEQENLRLHITPEAARAISLSSITAPTTDTDESM